MAGDQWTEAEGGGVFVNIVPQGDAETRKQVCIP